MNIERLFESIRTIYESQKQDRWIYCPNLYIYGKSVEADVISQDIENLREATYITEQNSLIDDYRQVGIEIKQFKFKKKAEYEKQAESVYIGYQVFMNEEQPIFDISQRSKLMTGVAYFDSLYLRGIKVIAEDEQQFNQFCNFINVSDTFEIKYSTFDVRDLRHTFADMDSKNLIIDNCEIYAEKIMMMFLACRAVCIKMTNNRFHCGSDVHSMFSSCPSLNELDLTGNKSFKITNAFGMFSECTLLMEVKGLDCLDVSECTKTEYLFSDCKLLKEIDISSWELNKLEYATKMFEGMSNLTNIYIGKIKASKDLKLTNFIKGTNKKAKIHMKEKINSLDLDIESTDMCIADVKMIQADDYSESHLRMLLKQFTSRDVQDKSSKEKVIKVLRTFERRIGSNLLTRQIRLDIEYEKLLLNFNRSHNIDGEALEIEYQTYKCSDEEFIKNYMAKKAVFGSNEIVFDIGVCYLVYSLERDKPLIYIREQ